jgi:hypothetical protein
MSDGYDRLEAEWSFADQEREAYDYEFNARYDSVHEAYGDSGDAMQDWMDRMECADCPAPVVSDAALNDYVDPNDDVPF